MKSAKKPEKKTASLNFRKAVIYFLIFALAAIPFALGKYYEFNTPDPFDSGANVYSAQHILSGAKIGVEEFPSADLGTLLVNMLGVKLFGFSEFGPKFLQGVFQAAALIFMFFAMRKIFGLLAAAVGVIVASVYLQFPYVAKFGNVKEQFMIACMVMGISCYIFYQLGGRKIFAILTGVFIFAAPLFKATGLSAIAALGLFIIAQPVLKNRSWKQTFVDIGFVAAGAFLVLAPIYIWIIFWNVPVGTPYTSIWNFATNLILPAKATAGKTTGSYVSSAWEIMPFSQLWPRVVRFSIALILPVSLAVGAICAGVVRLFRKAKTEPKISDRFVLLLAVWWVLDLAFACISPRSYEQYYLPMIASASFLGGYFISFYSEGFARSYNKPKWAIIGLAGLFCMILMSWHVFAGMKKSPWSGLEYGEKRHGYIQANRDITQFRSRGMKGAWEMLGNYIRQNSSPSDKIYVWGWYPGIYVQAQRFSPAPKAFESEMHIRPPHVLAEVIQVTVKALEEEKPKFIVDSRKRHLPLDRPPFELWPIMPKGLMGIEEPKFLPNNENVVYLFEKAWENSLRKDFGEEEAKRFAAMKPLRDFVMENYEIVKVYEPHILFGLKTADKKDSN